MRLENRTGKVIALGRLALAVFFLVATRYGMDGPPSYPLATFGLACLYLAVAVGLLIVAWSSWWLEHRLKLPSHLLDIFFFVALDLSTGVTVSSPFFVFFVFLVLSAAARWGWKAALITAGAATLLFAFETSVELYEESMLGDDYVRAIIRGGHLVVLSLMIAWFGMTHLSSRYEADHFQLAPGAIDPPFQAALTHMARCLDAERAALVWWEEEEPWINLVTRSAEGFEEARLGPADCPWLVADAVAGATFLFDARRRHILMPVKGRLTSRTGIDAVNPDLAARLGVKQGLVTPLETEVIQGIFVLSEIDGMCWDDLPIARKVALDIASAFERSAVLRASLESAEGHTKLAVARDLHDSMSQILAGVGLKLRAARTNAESDADRDRQLDAIEQELVEHQQLIRHYIQDLRNPPSDALRVDLARRLDALAQALARQWRIEIEFAADQLGAAPRGLEAEIDHLTREAVANAVRHGKATRIALSAHEDGGNVVLSCADNGGGFATKGTFGHDALEAEGLAPRSILERVEALGGTVGLVSRDDGATVEIRLPLRSVAR